MGLYEEIKFLSKRYFGTDCYLTYIPHLDRNGNQIKLKRGFPGNPNDGTGGTAREFYSKDKYTLVLNASTATIAGAQLRGRQIYNSVDINGLENDISADRWTLTIGDDGTLNCYSPDITVSQLLNMGVTNALTGFYPLINEGNIIAIESSKEPRQVIGQLPNKDIIVLTCDGRTAVNSGLTYNEVCEILLDEYPDIVFAYNLDGGGSAQTVLRGAMLNRPIDENGKVERNVFDFLYIDRDEEVTEDYMRLAEMIADNRKLIMELKSVADRHPNPANFEKTPEIVNNLNNVVDSGVYRILSSTIGSPFQNTTSGFSMHFTIDKERGMHQQMAIPFGRTANQKVMRRTKTEGAWSSWYEV